MNTILKKNNISSLRESLNIEYKKPDVSKQDEFISELKTNEEALLYLKVKRGLSEETINYFKLGYCKEKNAISIPEYKNGELVNIKYRYISDDAKQRYSQEKGGESWIFNEVGIEVARKKGGILITEGQFDAMSAWQAGYKNVISPSSGKESYGVWLDILDTIPKVYIAFDNDKGGKVSAKEMADRVGNDKCYHVIYPEDTKDANEYFKKYKSEDFRVLLQSALGFYRYDYNNLHDVINSIREKGETRLELKYIPGVKIHEDWMIMVSGDSGVGKTSYVMNLADELVTRGIPTLILPFERGIKDVGSRFLSIRTNKTETELIGLEDYQWEKVINDVSDLKLYLSLPTRETLKDTVEKAKRYFGIKVVIIDHLDYSIINTKGNEATDMKNTLQEWKQICLDNNIIFVVVHHISKPANSAVAPKKLVKENLKGGSASYQVPEVVVMLNQPEIGQIEIDIVKNKGEKMSKIFGNNESTGRIGKEASNIEIKPLTQQEEVYNKAKELFDF